MSKDYNYASAPYNFIPFPKKVVYRHKVSKKNEEVVLEDLSVSGENICHNSYKENKKTGYIRYKIKVKTPTFIGDGKGEIFKINGQPVIPGSTIRGKIRSNAEILSCAYPEFVENKKLWYREVFSKGNLKTKYMNRIKPDGAKIQERVKAGYLVKVGNAYRIIEAKEDENGHSFKEVNEYELRQAVENNKVHHGLEKEIFMYELRDEHLWSKIQNLKNEKKPKNKELKLLYEKNSTVKLNFEEQERKESLEEDIKKIEEDIKKLLKNNEVKSFTPYFCNILYNKDKNIIEKIVRKTEESGYCILMNSSRLNYKQNHYIIYEENPDKSRNVDNEIVNSFKTNVKYSNFISKTFDLPKEGKKPVFYILDHSKEKVIAFGFTPYLKIPYEKSVHDGIKTSNLNKEELIDYVQGLFGFSNLKCKLAGKQEEISYKGRVSFTNAKLVIDKNFKPLTHKSLMGPKISSFQLYLNQPEADIEKLKTYDDDFELRGQKFYWLKDKEDDRDDFEIAKKQNKGKKQVKEAQFAKLTPISEGSVFEGKIYFENLSEDELGLLLMSIKPFNTAKDSLGQGKPYGFGKIEFYIIEIKEIDVKNRFKGLNEKYKKAEDIDTYKKAFKDYMKKNGEEINFEEGRWKSFYISRKEEVSSKSQEFKYMKLNDSRYKDRNVLKSMEELSVDKNIDEEDKNEFDLVKYFQKFNGDSRIRNKRK